MFWTVVMLGALNGICTSMSVCISYLYIQHWAPDNAAILVASISCFPNLLSVLQNQVMTAVVNPGNLQPDVQDGGQVYFSQPEVLERVPRAIILQAIMTICLQVLGYLLVSTPPSKSASAPSAFDVRTGEPNKNLDKQRHLTGSKTRAILNNLEQDSLLDIEKQHVNGNNIKCYTTSKNGCEIKYPNIHELAKETRFIAQNINDGTVTNDNAEVPPSQVIQTSVFWTLWFSWVALSYSTTMAFNFYKQFALLFIPDDYFLTFLGSVVPIGSSAARLAFGHFIDKDVLSIKDNLVISLASHSVLFAFWYFIPRIHKFVYLFFVLCLTIPQSIFYVVFPPAVIRIFGSTHFSTILGLLNTGQTVSGLVLAVLVTPVIELLGWFWFFMTCSVLNMLALSVTLSNKLIAEKKEEET
ncbi:transporter, major facilitator family protein [Plakobranchus ocellatus]|uniref:Transporter, major facilitator family protein n=1 Tax=Plakobranchus ocellatus TaxID=259542 RepID=A0AAV4CGA9_9GAST|nr:transporter, major facilitator family protein [Plakobranchus ocellatus]